MKDVQKDKEMKKKVTDLFHKFYFGDEMTSLEREIELEYLIHKLQKYISWGRLGVNSPYFSISNLFIERTIQVCLYWQQPVQASREKKLPL